ncbi:MAG: hypothetical protein NC191_06870, partial [Muribaculaceae bacterium]|nr:hypothetical protein [Muribaculaceae bacterium]
MDKVKAFIVPILLLLAMVYGAYTGITGINTNHNEYTVVKADIETKQATVQEKETKLAELQRKEEEE